MTRTVFLQRQILGDFHLERSMSKFKKKNPSQVQGAQKVTVNEDNWLQQDCFAQCQGNSTHSQ